jgi:DNA-binding transcriptional LysR family regulator
MDLRHLEILVAIATHKNLARAARSANLSKSAVSRSLLTFESELGATLVDRAKRELELTTAGMMVFTHAQEILARTADLVRQVGVLRGEKRQKLNLGAGPYAADLFVTDAVAELCTLKSQIRVHYMIANRGALRQSLLARDLEVMVAGVGDFEAEKGIELEPLEQHQVYFVVRSSHPLAGMVDVGLDQVFSYPLAIATRLGPGFVAPMAKHMSGRSERPMPTIECDDFLAIRKIVKRCDAVTAFPLAAVEAEVRNGELAVIPLRLPWMRTDFGFAQLHGRTLSRAANELKRLVIEKNGEALARGEKMEKHLFSGQSLGRAHAVAEQRRKPVGHPQKK